MDEDGAARLAALAYQLPKGGRTWAKVAPAAANGVDTLLLREIEHNQRLWHWAHTDDAKDKGTAPQPITLPGEDEVHESLVEREERNAEDIARKLGLNLQGGVADG